MDMMKSIAAGEYASDGNWDRKIYERQRGSGIAWDDTLRDYSCEISLPFFQRKELFIK